MPHQAAGGEQSLAQLGEIRLSKSSLQRGLMTPCSAPPAGRDADVGCDHILCMTAYQIIVLDVGARRKQ